MERDGSFSSTMSVMRCFSSPTKRSMTCAALGRRQLNTLCAANPAPTIRHGPAAHLDIGAVQEKLPKKLHAQER
jgi:hypothetical protein